MMIFQRKDVCDFKIPYWVSVPAEREDKIVLGGKE